MSHHVDHEKWMHVEPIGTQGNTAVGFGATEEEAEQRAKALAAKMEDTTDGD